MVTKADVKKCPHNTALAVPAQDFGAVLERGWIVKISNTGMGFVVLTVGGFQDQTEESSEQPGLIAEAGSALSEVWARNILRSLLA